MASSGHSSYFQSPDVDFHCGSGWGKQEDTHRTDFRVDAHPYNQLPCMCAGNLVTQLVLGRQSFLLMQDVKMILFPSVSLALLVEASVDGQASIRSVNAGPLIVGAGASGAGILYYRSRLKSLRVTKRKSRCPLQS